LGLNRDGLPHIGIDTGSQIMLRHFQLAATFRTGRHGHLVTTDAPIVIPDDSDARRHDVPGQVAVDQVSLGPRSAHVAVPVHEPAPRHHEHGRVTSGTGRGREIDLSGEPRPAVTGWYLEVLGFHVARRGNCAGEEAVSGSYLSAQRLHLRPRVAPTT